jgi:hypothetical protein
MTLAGHCPIPETIQTTLKSQSVCIVICIGYYAFGWL